MPDYRTLIFPARREWPSPLDDVSNAPSNTERLRLVSGADNLKKLPSLKFLKELWCFDIDEKNLNFICDCTTLDALFIENIKTGNLSCLKRLSFLKYLGIETCSKITSLDVFCEFQSLIGLAISHFKQVHDLEPLAALKSLRALAVSGSMWTKMKVTTFEPLRALKNLELLHLTNIQPEHGSLKPLGDLKTLKQLDLANFYEMSDFAWLSQRLKDTECIWFKSYIEMNYTACKRCGNATQILLTGRRKSSICIRCDKTAFEKHIREWNKAIV